MARLLSMEVLAVILVVVGVWLYVVQSRKDREQARKDREARELELQRQEMLADMRLQLRDIVEEHLHVLLRKRRIKLRRDDYGNFVAGPWLQEKEYFWESVVAKSPSGYQIDWWLGPKGTVTRDETLTVLDELIDECAASNPASEPVDVDALSPEAFEGFCAEVLAGSGWEASAGGGPGDQGIDIVATRDGMKAVFQCKKYSQPVGNKAVQEVLAGKAFASADLAFVVTNTSFTASAYALANASGVFLIHYSQLDDLDEYMVARGPA